LVFNLTCQLNPTKTKQIHAGPGQDWFDA